MRPVLPLLMLLATAAAPAPRFTIGGEAFTQAEILDARAMPDMDGTAAIMLTLDPPAARRLLALTKTQVGRKMAVVLDGAVLVEPVLAAPIDGGVVEVAGHFAVPQAEALAKRISGKAPLPDSLDQ